MKKLENNKLIAEFMGAIPIYLGASKEYEMYGIIDCIEDGVDEKHFFIEDEMMFLSSWDWLMPVIATIYDSSHADVNNNLIGDITHALLDVNIEVTYEAVVEFIKWFNQKQNNEESI